MYLGVPVMLICLLNPDQRSLLEQIYLPIFFLNAAPCVIRVVETMKRYHELKNKIRHVIADLHWSPPTQPVFAEQTAGCLPVESSDRRYKPSGPTEIPAGTVTAMHLTKQPAKPAMKPLLLQVDFLSLVLPCYYALSLSDIVSRPFEG